MSLDGIEESIQITKLEVDSITKRIMLLSLKEIDDLWFNSGWVESDKGKNRSLSSNKIEKIKKDINFAKNSWIDLITDDSYNVLRTSAIFLTQLSLMDGKE